ncbi:MAG: glycosyltransferase family 4 protein [Clostridiaceae bacterium]
MKVLLYFGSMKMVSKSGIGQALRHQGKALKKRGIPYTINRREEYDIVHINTIFPNSLLMSKIAMWRHKKVVYFAHSTMEDFRNSFVGSNMLAPLFKRWITYCYNSSNIVITPTIYSKNLLENYGIIPPVFNLSNGVDTSFYGKDLMSRMRFREKYGVKEHEKIIMSVGHYIERKGILDFVCLAEQMPEYQFYWFGYTNMNLIPQNIQNAVTTSLENLHFPGYINQIDLKDAYCGSDLFLFLSHEETEGIALLEALASKIPILIRDIPVYADWLYNGKNVYKAKNISDFREKIVQIIEKNIPDLTENGYQVAVERDLKMIGQRLEEIYTHGENSGFME